MRVMIHFSRHLCAQAPTFDAGLLGVLCCPISKKKLSFIETKNTLLAESGIEYPIQDGIPILNPLKG